MSVRVTKEEVPTAVRTWSSAPLAEDQLTNWSVTFDAPGGIKTACSTHATLYVGVKILPQVPTSAWRYRLPGDWSSLVVTIVGIAHALSAPTTQYCSPREKSPFLIPLAG